MRVTRPFDSAQDREPVERPVERQMGVSRQPQLMTVTTKKKVPHGPAAAAILSAGVGAFALGGLTLWAGASAGVMSALALWAPAGSLTGKSGIAVIIWLLTWMVLHTIWKNREVSLPRVVVVVLVLLAGAYVLTFPPVFEAFHP